MRYTTTTTSRTASFPVPVATLATLRTDGDDEPRFSYAPRMWDSPAQARAHMDEDLVSPSVRRPREPQLYQVGGRWHFVAMPHDSLYARQKRAEWTRRERAAMQMIRQLARGGY